MKILNNIKFLTLLVSVSLVVLITGFITTPSKVFASHSRVDLLTADDFVVLAGSAVTGGAGTDVITGDVGLSPTAGSAITLLTCAEVNGTIYDVNGGYTGGGGGSTACLSTNAAKLTTAKNDLTTAYNDAAGRTTTSTIATELGGTTLTDGTYDSSAGTFGITGTLTLDGGGNANAVFIFKMASTLITASSSQVSLINGAQACNVYWQVGSSATLGTSTTLVGNVLALTSITDNGSSNVNGRLLARNGAVDLENTTINKAVCGAGTAGGPAAVASSTSSSGAAATKGCPALPSTVITPSIIESIRVDTDSIFIKWGPNSGVETFNIQYGLENGKWIYSTDVKGFSTTINNLPANVPIWFRVAARSDCFVGTFSEARLVGGGSIGGPTTVESNPNVVGVSLPNTGFGPAQKNIPAIPVAILGISILLFIIQRNLRYSSKH